MLTLPLNCFFKRFLKIAAATAEWQFVWKTVETGVELEDDSAGQTG